MTSINTYIDIDRLIKKTGKTDWYKALGEQAHHHIQNTFKTHIRDFPGGPVAKNPCSQYREPRFHLGQGTRSHMLELKKKPTCRKKDPK